MNYVANHHVSDGWLIDSGKQLDAPVGMAGFLFMLGSSIVVITITMNAGSQSEETLSTPLLPSL